MQGEHAGAEARSGGDLDHLVGIDALEAGLQLRVMGSVGQKTLQVPLLLLLGGPFVGPPRCCSVPSARPSDETDAFQSVAARREGEAADGPGQARPGR